MNKNLSVFKLHRKGVIRSGSMINDISRKVRTLKTMKESTSVAYLCTHTVSEQYLFPFVKSLVLTLSEIRNYFEII